VSLSISDAWTKDEHGKHIPDHKFDFDLSLNSSNRKMKETITKYSQETQDLKDKSTNLTSTIEVHPRDRNKII
jgi:hypothetical protein